MSDAFWVHFSQNIAAIAAAVAGVVASIGALIAAVKNSRAIREIDKKVDENTEISKRAAGDKPEQKK